jgi:hypothetical protein
MRIDDDKSVSSESEGPGDGKKGKVKKQEKQKKIVVNFVEAMTCATEETLQPEPVKCNEQHMPPLDKQKLLDLFEQHVNTKDISTSVFWKYTKREVYVDRNIYRNRKTGGYKGFSGVQWRNPDRPEDLAIMEPRLHKIRRYLARGKDNLIQNLRDICNGDDAGKGLKLRRKKNPSTPGKMPFGLVDHGAHEDVAGAHMLVQAAALSGQLPNLALGELNTSDVMAVVVAAAQQQQQQQQREQHQSSSSRRSRDSDDDDDDDMGAPPTKKMKLNDSGVSQSGMLSHSGSVGTTTTTTRTLLSSSSIASSSSGIGGSSSSSGMKSSGQLAATQYNHAAMQEQQQLVVDTLNNSIGHLQLVYQSLSTHTAIEMLKLLNDPEVLTALQNLKAIAPIINQQLGQADGSASMQPGQDQTHG